MQELDRRLMLKLVAGLSLAPYSALADEKQSTIHLVVAGTDRTGQPHKAARANSHLDFKVLTQGTNGALFIMENRNMVRGGPPRHVHYEQEEWFYFVEGNDEVLMEIGETKFRLKPGDSVFEGGASGGLEQSKETAQLSITNVLFRIKLVKVYFSDSSHLPFFQTISKSIVLSSMIL